MKVLNESFDALTLVTIIKKALFNEYQFKFQENRFQNQFEIQPQCESS